MPSELPPDPERLDSYLICATPRTGSSLLCGLLDSTGVAGHPESWFRRQDEREFAARWGIADPSNGTFGYAGYFRAAVAAGSTANGVFAARIMWGTMDEVTAHLAPVYPGHAGSAAGLLSAAFGRTRFVYLRRGGVVAQAVSLLRAEQTGVWFETAGERQEPAAEPGFDFGQVRGLVRQIEEDNAAWEAWFTAEGIQPYRLLYEDLDGDPVGIASGVLGFLGLDLPAGREITVRHKRLADELNARWVESYRLHEHVNGRAGIRELEQARADAVADPQEGVAADGTIVTGADRSRVPAPFEPLLADAVALAGECGASLYVYGSVANGTVRPGLSDVDLLSVGLADPPGLGRILSARYAELCRGVEVSAATAADLAGDSDAAYGFRVFLRHYCVHLAGPDPGAAFPAFPADASAARGFNGDIALHYQRWRQSLGSGTAGEDLLGVRAARKTLLAVAGLASIRDQTWTTDRARAARRWGEIEPDLAAPLGALLSWATAERRPSSEEVQLALAGDGVVAAVVDRFASLIGL